MQVSVVKIGNSKGIRIPKKVLDQCQVEDVLELTVKDNNILLEPVHQKPREGWVEAFETASKKYGEESLDTEWLDADLVADSETEATEW